MNTSSASWSDNPTISIETSNALCPTPNMYSWAFASDLSTKRTDDTTQFSAVQLCIYSTDPTKNTTQTRTEPTAMPTKTPTGHTGATLWDAIPAPSKPTNASHHLNNWLPHGLCSGSYSNQYIMGNIPIESCSDALIENEVHSLPNEIKETQLTSDLLRVFDSRKDKTEASFATIQNPMRRIISVCTNSTISNAKSHSQNRISLRIVNRHETIDTVFYASDITIGTEQHMRCLMVVLMLMFTMCKCPKRISFNTVILMTVSGVSGYESCDTAYKCVGQSQPINRWDSLASTGYKANSGGATDITIEWGTRRYMECSASFSCANIGYIKGSCTYDGLSWQPYLGCNGVFGCSNTSVNLTGNIERACSGSNSCYGVTFHSYGEAAEISCSGDRSCANTEIHNHNEIIAHGSYALYNATIHSTADGLNVTLSGSNTGFGAKIFCHLGHSCSIYCFSTGCNMLYVDCVGNCSLQSNSVDTVLPITEYSLFDESQLNILYDSSALAKSNDAACLLMVDAFEEKYHANISTSGTNVCCRGVGSCLGTTIYSDTRVVCSGAASCEASDNITANDAIFCSASRGCWWSNLYSLNDVYCLSSMACYDTTITARNLYCSGQSSCQSSTILNTETIYFSGSGSGNGAVINCTGIAFCSIICDGLWSCKYISSIYCNACTVSCDQDTGCPPGYTYTPTSNPTLSPTSHPTLIPTDPTMIPTYLPTHEPTRSPTVNPTIAPTNPSTIPTLSPIIPTSSPTSHPTPIPTMIPTSLPTHEPTVNPTAHPTIAPTSPSTIPTLNPTLTPTPHTTLSPTSYPTLNPTHKPTINPTLDPTHAPTLLTTDNIIIANHKDISEWMIVFYVLNVDTTCDGSIIDIAITDHLNYKDKWIHFEQNEYQRNGEVVILHQDAVFTTPISIRITRSDNVRNETLIGYDIMTSFTQSMRFDFGSNACVDDISPTEPAEPTPNQSRSSKEPNMLVVILHLMIYVLVVCVLF